MKLDFTNTDAVRTAYAAASVGEKSRIRTAHRAAIDAAIASGDIRLAQTVMSAGSVLVAEKTVVTVDYAARIADHAATLQAALTAVLNGTYVLPDGVTVTHSDIDWTAGSADRATVARYVTVSGRKVGRGDVVGFIMSALDAGDGSPMTVADIMGHRNEGYGNGTPSSGAIGAAFTRRLSGDSRYDDYGFDVVTNDTGTRAAVPVA